MMIEHYSYSYLLSRRYHTAGTCDLFHVHHKIMAAGNILLP